MNTIRETLAALDELAREPCETGAELADDLAAAELLCLTCEPPLAPAAISHLMAQFLRRRDAAELGRLTDELGHCAQ